MARVIALVPDLLFGSRVQAALQAGGHDVELLADANRLSEQIRRWPAGAAGVLVIDLTDAELDGAALLAQLADDGLPAGLRTLGFYSHVDVQTRERAERAGFDVVVARSRMARDAQQLVERLVPGR